MLYEQVVKRGITVYEEFFAWKLVEDGGRCVGRDRVGPALGRARGDPGDARRSSRTGGAGRLYVGTTNAYACTGDGMAMALRAGVALKDMEMMQFHPTTLAPTGVLITEGCRGEGAFLLNKDGERFLKRYAPNAMELASRDVISRAEQTEIDEGRGIDGNVMLDLRHLGAEKIIYRLPGTRELSMVFAGIDPIYEPIPVRPGRPLPHGRRRRPTSGAAPRSTGLYAAGEVACISVHGANRLGGNALMETITFGRRSGPRRRRRGLPLRRRRGVPTSAMRDAEAELKTLLDRKDGERPWKIRDELADDDARELRRLPARGADAEAGQDRRLRCASATSRSIVEDKGEVFNTDLTQALELGFLLELADCMVVAGLARKESRGAHARPYDFPDRDDANFLRHTVVEWKDGRPALDWKPVTFTKWEPAVRSY